MEEIGEGAGLRGEELSSGRGLVCMYASWEGEYTRIVGGVGIYEIAQPGQSYRQSHMDGSKSTLLIVV